MILLDTDVLVEYLRGSTAAKTWLTALPNEEFAIPGIAAMELLIGSENRAGLEKVRKFLSAFNVVWPDPSEFARAFDLLAAHCLSAGISIPDCLIAAMAISRSAGLYTFNLKHFKIVEGLDVRQPYARG
jgi:predicted nucleic acid-binding protein